MAGEEHDGKKPVGVTITDVGHSWACSCLCSRTLSEARSKSQPCLYQCFQPSKLYVLDPEIDFLRPTYADVLLLQAGLVFNTAFATLLLKEPFTRFSLIGTILTCAGAATIATFGAIGEPAHSLSQLLDFLNQRPFILWMIGTMLVAVGAIVFAHILKIYTK